MVCTDPKSGLLSTDGDDDNNNDNNDYNDNNHDDHGKHYDNDNNYNNDDTDNGNEISTFHWAIFWTDIWVATKLRNLLWQTDRYQKDILLNWFSAGGDADIGNITIMRCHFGMKVSHRQLFRVETTAEFPNEFFKLQSTGFEMIWVFLIRRLIGCLIALL